MIARRRSNRLAVLIAALTVGCGAGADPGGPEDGTFTDTLPICDDRDERPVGPEHPTAFGTPTQVRDRFVEGLQLTRAVPLRWNAALGGEVTALSIESVAFGAPFLRDATVGCTEQLRIPATLRLRTADGVLDVTLAGDLRRFQDSVSWSVILDDPPLTPVEALRAYVQQRLALPALGVHTFSAGFGFPGTSAARVGGSLNMISNLVDLRVHAALAPMAEFAAVLPQPEVEHDGPAGFIEHCRAEQPTVSAFDMFRSKAVLTDALVGTWLLCGSKTSRAANHAGIRIAADGTWTHIAEVDRAALELRGFGHEGTWDIIDTSEINQVDVLQFNLADVPQEFGFSSDRRTLRLARADQVPEYDNVYVRSELPVEPPQLLRAPGERAGTAACSEGEAFVRGFDTIDELRAGVVGTWTICQGGFRPGATALSFTADDRYRHLDAGGNAIAEGRYDLLVHDHPPGWSQISMTDDDAPADRLDKVYAIHPMRSDVPAKLLANDGATNTVLSAMP